jgi:hypothetical protein
MGNESETFLKSLGIGDWGLGIGDYAQSPIPNPPILFFYKFNLLIKKNFISIILFNNFNFKYFNPFFTIKLYI